MYTAFAKGDLLEAQRQQQIIQRVRRLFKDNLAYFKAALAWRGLPLGGPRPPIRDLQPMEWAELLAGLEQLTHEFPEIL